MSIATEIERLQTAKSDLKTAIEGKGVTVPSATKLDGYADLVDAIQTGGGSWIKNDGKTYLHINLFTDYYLTIYLAFSQSVASGNTIDWGDGSEPTTPTNTNTALVSHAYASKGEYIITITNTNGNFWFSEESTIRGYIFQDGITSGSGARFRTFPKILKKAELGQGWRIDKGRQFSECKDLTDVYISRTPSGTKLGGDIFSGCLSLINLTFLDGGLNGITTAGNYCFNGCGSLPVPIIPPNLTVIPCGYMQMWDNTGSIIIDIPEGVTQISTSAFKNWNTFDVVIPSTVTSIQNDAFNGNYGCHAVHLKPTTPPTLGNANAFSTNNAYTYAQVMYVPYSEDHSILEAYKTATNWSTFAEYMVEENLT